MLEKYLSVETMRERQTFSTRRRPSYKFHSVELTAFIRHDIHSYLCKRLPSHRIEVRSHVDTDAFTKMPHPADTMTTKPEESRRMERRAEILKRVSREYLGNCFSIPTENLVALTQHSRERMFSRLTPFKNER